MRITRKDMLLITLILMIEAIAFIAFVRGIGTETRTELSNPYN